MNSVKLATSSSDAQMNVVGREQRPFVPSAIKARHLAVLACLYDSAKATGTLRTEPILNDFLCGRVGMAEQGMRTLLKRFRFYGWLAPLAAKDVRQDGTVHTFEPAVWERLREYISSGDVVSWDGNRESDRLDGLAAEAQKIVGVQRMVIKYLVYLSEVSGSEETGPVSINDLCAAVDCNHQSVRKSLQRLGDKRFIEHRGIKAGPGGWTSYRIPGAVKAAISRQNYVAAPAAAKVENGEDQPVWIYFIQEGGAAGNIKIGLSTGHPKHRLAQLQTGSSTDLLLLHFTRAPRDTEAQLHARFAHINVRGEWFRPDRELIDFIEQMRTTGKTPATEATFKQIMALLQEHSLSQAQRKAMLGVIDPA